MNPVSILELLQSFRRGALLSAADAEMARVIEAMHETGGNGTLDIKLKFKVNKAGQIELTGTAAGKAPLPDHGTGIYYHTDDGRLTRRDPNQLDLEDYIGPGSARAAE